MKYVYSFGRNTEGKKEMKDLLGGKGANLAEMALIGIPVPPGFTISTQTCEEYIDNIIPKQAVTQIQEYLTLLEEQMGQQLGNPESPLLLSVRSGAAVSMPGMMDTILNLGMNDEVAESLSKKNERFAYDSYRRFIQMYGDVVMGVAHEHFENILRKQKEKSGVNLDTELSASDLLEIITNYKEVIVKETGKEFPQDVQEQLFMAIKSVFDSWNNNRAKHYRKLNNIKGLKGTAVNVQAMVFGNLGEKSATGVCFTRNPSTGYNSFYGEYLTNAQGEDVVAGIRTPLPIRQLAIEMPAVYDQLVSIYKKLEKHFTDMQDMEFTIQEGKLYLLQTRTGKRTAQAAVRIAVEMVEEGLIDERTAVLRVNPASLDQLLHKQLDEKEKQNHTLLGKGLPASPGGAVGRIVFDNASAVELKKKGESVILVRNDTSPEDLIGMDAAVGILTAKGGMTSHAAVVARGMGKCCVSGLTEAKVTRDSLQLDDKVFKQGDYITLDGSTGEVYEGQIQTVDPELASYFGKIMEYADKYRMLSVRTNAETPQDAKKAIEYGAEGIGLCRTEHMFFEGERVKFVREMIMADNRTQRIACLDKLLPFQKKDFEELFTIMNGKPVTIRLLDPPLHEFLPKEEEKIQELANLLGKTKKELYEKIEQLTEVNPMLGHRGCRLAITYPEITRMQATAIFEAAQNVMNKGIEVQVEVMVPLVGTRKEFTNQNRIIREVAAELGIKNFKVGTMIEVPRAALTADIIAKDAEFFSFGTNDLTQMTYGYSRDDIASFVPEYIEKGIIEKDPFQVLDQKGVGQLLQMAVHKGKAARPDIKLGICGEHGGEPKSVEFCHKIGLHYVSCSPFRVPIARLAAAQAAIKYN